MIRIAPLLVLAVLTVLVLAACGHGGGGY